tara:strand:- start:355 stop:960 length:606 start_codon:yes stop_codon:yes gene_type:complete
MIEIISKNKTLPYKRFFQKLDFAISNKQNPVDAILISSYDEQNKEVDSRYVNLKYIDEMEWTFFTNYSSPKANQFDTHPQISAVIYWEKIDCQIRIKANIKKSSQDFSNLHFKKRSVKKNALAISSDQSKKIDSFKTIETNYKDTLKEIDAIGQFKRPENWGGYTFIPYYFEFWEGHKYRINKREAYEFKNDHWDTYIMQP